MADLKKIACNAIEEAASELHALSDDIWNHPELGFQEKHAHDVLTQFLKDKGLQVEESYKLETAFRGTYGSETKPNICVISEYDALPEIGHACGHNLIAEVGVASAVGIMAAMKASGESLCKLTILGTPAEEGFGGKVDMIKAGAFEDIDIAMMSHPFPENDPTPIMLARENLEVTYVGKPSHAAGFPWEGVNALDAAVTCYNSIACLRQQLKPEWRVHCIIKEGGVRVNIIPEKATLQLAVRAPLDKDVALLKQKVVACFNAAATATGCQMSYKTLDKAYSSVLHNRPLVELYEKNLAGFVTDDIPTNKSALCGSTDMGNVTHLVPGIHPHFYIGGVGVNHTRGFTGDAGHPRAQKYTLIQAKAIAMTAVDIMLNPELLTKIKESFKADLQSGV